MDIEKIAAKLSAQGYYADLRREPSQWSCTLFTSKLKANPVGTGATALDALYAANDDKARLESDPRYKA